MPAFTPSAGARVARQRRGRRAAPPCRCRCPPAARRGALAGGGGQRVAEQFERREHVAGRRRRRVPGSGRRTRCAPPVTRPPVPRSRARRRRRAAGRRTPQAAPSASVSAPRRLPAGRAGGVQQRVPADQVGGRHLVHRRPGLRAEPGQRGLEALAANSASSKASPEDRNSRASSRPPAAGALSDAPQRPAEAARRRRCLERGEDPPVAAPNRDEGAVRGGVASPQTAAIDAQVRSRSTEKVMPPPGAPGTGWNAHGSQSTYRSPHSARSSSSAMPVCRTITCRLEPRSTRKPGKRSTVETAPPSDGVALDHLDVEAGRGEVAGGDQAVVAGADHDDVAAPRPARLTRSRLPRTAYRSGLPGKRNRSAAARSPRRRRGGGPGCRAPRARTAPPCGRT